MEYRTEHDSMGEIEVEKDKYWGAATERSRRNFTTGSFMPSEVIYALAALKLAAARANSVLQPNRMTKEKLTAIELAVSDIISGKLDGHFPLRVYQTGSGTQTNMNVNEVIANRGKELTGIYLHPNDDVNMSQSSNDIFPSAMHVSAAFAIDKLIAELTVLADVFLTLEKENTDAVKTGRTHLQDATPITFAEEISGWRTSLLYDIDMLTDSKDKLRKIALGGTAVGTGLNSPRSFGAAAAAELSKILGTEFKDEQNKFHALTSKGELVFAHGAMKATAADLMKIANDIRFLAGGPRCGLGEIRIPENEPGSSIMPGKINPTQCEALTMVCVRVMGNDTTVGIAASQGNFELNVYMPVTIHAFLESAELLVGAVKSFVERCASGIVANKEKMREYAERSLMSATALNPHIGYENTAKIVKLAHKEGISLKEAAVKLEILDGDEFDKIYRIEDMV